MNVFRFHAVGQGLFYTGNLANDTYRFVYDCGSLSGMPYLNKAIDLYRANFSGDTRPYLDFVAISHLHKDHFNGLPYLLSRFRCKKIYLPYLGEDKAFIRFLLFYEIFGREQTAESSEEQLALFRTMSALYRLDGNDNALDGEMKIFFLGDPQASSEPFSYRETVELGGNPYWEFRFLNDDTSLERLKSLADSLHSYFKKKRNNDRRNLRLPSIS